jgi:penicillin-binding protein 2
MNKKYGKWGWSKGALLNISIGQGELLVTPLQVALYTNILATRGETYPLHLVNNKLNKLNKINIRNSTWKLLEKAMRAVIISPKGTGRRADPKIKGLDIFGKTGTAENPHGEPHAWFIGYGLKNDKMMSIVIMLENGGHGGEVAAPIARSIFKKYFENDYKIAIK